MTHGKPSLRTYFFTWAALLGLTLITSLIGLVDLGRMTLVIAIGIALLKAALIAFLFMHAMYGTKLVRTAIVGGLVYFGFLLTLTLGDYLSRGWLLPSGK